MRSLAPREGGGYAVRYVEHDAGDEGRKLNTRDPRVRPERELTCDRLVLAAGNAGLDVPAAQEPSRLPGPQRPARARRFGGNGDLLTFALGANRPLDRERTVP